MAVRLTCNETHYNAFDAFTVENQEVITEGMVISCSGTKATSAYNPIAGISVTNQENLYQGASCAYNGIVLLLVWFNGADGINLCDKLIVDESHPGYATPWLGQIDCQRVVAESLVAVTSGSTDDTALITAKIVNYYTCTRVG